MSDEERKLNSKIYFLEDLLLRCKDFRKAEIIQGDLMMLRKTLQRMKWENLNHAFLVI